PGRKRNTRISRLQQQILYSTMKTFKGLFIDQGIIKAGEFPVEPDSCFLPFCETDGTDIEYCKCHELETEYERAMRDAKANAVECEDRDGAGKMIAVKAPYAGNNFIFPLPSGWDYRVEVWHKDSKYFLPKSVAKLYRVDEQTKIEELRKKLDAFLATQTKEQLEK